MKGVILHGGHGTRLRPLTHTGPKQLIPIANKPVSQYALEDLRDSGIEDIAMVIGGILPEKVKQYYQNGQEFGVRITYVEQDRPIGIAHAVGLTESFVGDSPFVVYLGDNLLKGGISSFVKEFRKDDYDAMVLLCEVQEPQRFGVAEFSKDGKLMRLVEKPREPPSNYALTGIYFLTPAIFGAVRQLVPSWRGELEITEALQFLMEKGYSVGYRLVEGWWKDTGTVEDILEANRLVLDDSEPSIIGTVEDKECIQGRVSVAKDAVIKKGALIRGPALIGEGSKIEEGVYIGPYTSVGRNVTFKRGEIENSIIMDDCLVNINEKLVDSLVGPNTRIVTNMRGPKGRKLIVGESSKIVL